MPTPDRILELVQHFETHRDSFHKGQYKEAQLREEFLNPVFEALGWDMANRQGYAEAYKEVIHEDAIKIGGFTKAPDYAFRIGGQRKFFVEAKKPKVSLGSDVEPAYQLRRYAWSAKLPLSILTDFEEWAIYDCRVKPVVHDKPSTARIAYFPFTELPERWPELAEVFSREAVLKGAFDRYAEATRGKKGTAEVDAEFLKELEGWRELLAQNIALRNPSLSVRDLNHAVQQTIDRIIFLRICEDRAIEPYGQLEALMNGANVYQRLQQIYHQADARYNSGLFHFAAEKDQPSEPDTLTLALQIDDKPLKTILGNLYYPKSPYEFGVLPADILGQVYEQFLGKVIRLTPGHRAVVEDKPAVKKAGGVFYTPTYIVDYIVRHTVGKLVEGKAPREVEALRIADPACGSGSFLIGAYQHLLDWHLGWYLGHDPAKQAKAGKLFEAHGGDWRLTAAERKRILLNNIYGVDIDRQAVEVTKLSLLLKVLEGENEETIGGQQRFLKERALPDLGSNIKCGNSLIGTEFYHGPHGQAAMFEDDEYYRINAFDWEAEFKAVMRPGSPDGGFDAVIGNPPYIRIQTMKEWAPIEVEHYKQAYRSASKGNYDIYVVFVERGLQLLNPHGRLGYILPHKFFNAQYGAPLRAILADSHHLAEVVHFGDKQIFAGATTYTCLMFLDKAGAEEVEFTKVDDLAAWRLSGEATTGEIPAAKVGVAEWNFVVSRGAELFERLREMPVKLGDVAELFVGLQTSADPVFLFKNQAVSVSAEITVFSKQLGREARLESALLKPVVRNRDIRRYTADASALVLFPYVRVGAKYQLVPIDSMASEYPLTWRYLNENKLLLSKREHGKFSGSGWYQLYPKNLDTWDQPKLLLPYMITRLISQFDQDHLYFVNVTTGGFGLVARDRSLDLRYLCGLINSALLDWTLKQVTTSFHGGYFAANKQFVVQLPIRLPSPTSPTDTQRHDQLVQLVQRMLDLHKRVAAMKTEQDRKMVRQQIEVTDRQIDRLVYELYELTEAEIGVVEGRG